MNLREAKVEAVRQANETGGLYAVTRPEDHGDEFNVEPFVEGKTTTSWYRNFGVYGPGALLDG